MLALEKLFSESQRLANDFVDAHVIICSLLWFMKLGYVADLLVSSLEIVFRVTVLCHFLRIFRCASTFQYM